MRRLKHSAFIALAIVTTASLATGAEEKTSQDREAALRSQPGYVDFSMLDKLGQEAKVEVNLRDPMLGLVGKFIGEDDPELKDLLAGLKLVRVRVYAVTPETIEKLLAAGSEASLRLDRDGWERIVRVRDEGEHVDVYFKPSRNTEWIEGVLVIAVGEDDEAAFVNIVGTIRPEDVSRIGDHLDIDGMDKVRIEKKIRN
ncbi:MAG TPA: DUF4252 domain-containing protein [Candidatus Krumholzibacteria bacterium]|nr:DUF4252 domain-containing protein [Candidatus Krumholzibacteria bacterium]